MKYSLVCCYMTHNHPEVVDEILSRSLKAYSDHGIDVCICDDSSDDKTKMLVDQYIKKGADNLYYADAHESLNANHKYYLTIQGKFLPKDYDYIWPCKDRTCFESSCLDNLCDALDEGHDVIILTNEGQRCDVGINVFRDVYTDPAEFYRLYCSASANWESLIRKRCTMLTPIDWNKYNEKYSINGDNCFNQTLSLFARLSDMKDCSIRVCRFDFNERYISPNASSDWGKILFNLWIDRWVTANFSLPSMYDKYKAEAIKSETNLSELFGSTERMIEFHAHNMYNREIFEKYRTMWSFVTDIPIDVLEMIADGDYNNALIRTIEDFNNSFAAHDYNRAWWLIAGNTWFKEYYDATTYGLLVMCFNKYRENMQHLAASAVFDGVSSIDDLKKKYGVTV